MPTYDYKCTACSHTFEHFQSMKDKPLKKCPECGKNALERLIGTGAAVLFKGSGFYQTDYRSEGYKKAADADKPAETKPDTKSDKKTDTKPAASTPNGKEAPKAKPPESKTADTKLAKSKVGKGSKD